MLLLSQGDLDVALRSAAREWGTRSSDPVSIRLAPINPCRTGVNSVEMADTITSTTVFDRGPESRSHVIEINSNCDWSVHPLPQVVLHEYGHVLMGPGHSDDNHSVMFWVIHSRKQKITAADRERLRAAQGKRK